MRCWMAFSTICNTNLCSDINCNAMFFRALYVLQCDHPPHVMRCSPGRSASCNANVSSAVAIQMGNALSAGALHNLQCEFGRHRPSPTSPCDCPRRALQFAFQIFRRTAQTLKCDFPSALCKLQRVFLQAAPSPTLQCDFHRCVLQFAMRICFTPRVQQFARRCFSLRFAICNANCFGVAAVVQCDSFRRAIKFAMRIWPVAPGSEIAMRVSSAPFANCNAKSFIVFHNLQCDFLRRALQFVMHFSRSRQFP